MKPTPPGWPRIASALHYEQARPAIDWLCAAFGFEVRLLIEGEEGRIEHSELVYGEGVIMLGDKRGKYPHRRAPSELAGANTQSMMVYVDDVEAHFERAKKAGAVIVEGLSVHDYGEAYWSDRGYECVDLGGHHWWFFQRLRGPSR